MLQSNTALVHLLAIPSEICVPKVPEERRELRWDVFRARPGSDLCNLCPHFINQNLANHSLTAQETGKCSFAVCLRGETGVATSGVVLATFSEALTGCLFTRPGFLGKLAQPGFPFSLTKCWTRVKMFFISSVIGQSKYALMLSVFMNNNLAILIFVFQHIGQQVEWEQFLCFCKPITLGLWSLSIHCLANISNLLC